MDYTILIGGAAGQGIETFVYMLEKTIKRTGYNIFTYKNYMSMVRGGHNFIQIRFSEEEVYTYKTKVDMIVALNSETIDLHKHKLKEDGVIITDSEIDKSKYFMNFAFKEISNELGNIKVIPVIAFGLIAKYFGLNFDLAKRSIEESLSEKILDVNLGALRKGYDLVETKINLKVRDDKKILINGNQALALGAIAAGCKYYCGYPMTPSTSIMTYISSKANQMGIVVDQIEDEVGALNMAIGASYAGVRAMTASSGGGFSLMVEALSLAGVSETPIVLVNAQRPGPATGLSTRTEQGDLRFVIHAGHGEFPRMVMALRSPKDAFYQTARAFNLAEKYQIPVIIMTEEYLTDYMITSEPFDLEKISIDRNISEKKDLSQSRYKRYEYSESGVSKRIIPGKFKDKLVLLDSHEHNEYGNIDESIETRVKMMDKRMHKFDLLEEEVEEPIYFGSDKPEYLLVGFGATYGALYEAVISLNRENIPVGGLVYGDLWPFPTKKIIEIGQDVNKLIVVEQNKTSQLGSLIREKTRLEIFTSILKYDGRPINADEIIEEFKKNLDK